MDEDSGFCPFCIGILREFAVHTNNQSPQTQLSQNLVDGCQLIGVHQLAQRLHRSVATVRTQVTREPAKLPPRFPIPGSSQVVWMLSVVIDWMIQQQANSHLPSTPITKLNGKRRGAPTTREKLAAKSAGMSITEFREVNLK